MGFTNFDLVAISVISLTAFFALLKGFTRSFVSFLGLIAFSFFSYKLFDLGYLKPLVEKFSTNELILLAGSALLSAIIAGIITSFITYKLNSSFEPISGGFLDRSAGIGFGLAKGYAYVAIFVASISTFTKIMSSDENKEDPKWLMDSKTYSMIKISSDQIEKIIENKIADNSYIKSLTQKKTKSPNVSKDVITKIGHVYAILQNSGKTNLTESAFKDLVSNKMDDQAKYIFLKELMAELDESMQDGKISKRQVSDEKINTIKDYIHSLNIKDNQDTETNLEKINKLIEDY